MGKDSEQGSIRSGVTSNIWKMGPRETQKLLCSKGNSQSSEEEAERVEENTQVIQGKKKHQENKQSNQKN